MRIVHPVQAALLFEICRLRHGSVEAPSVPGRRRSADPLRRHARIARAGAQDASSVGVRLGASAGRGLERTARSVRTRRSMAFPKTILVPTDFSTAGARACDFACEL